MLAITPLKTSQTTAPKRAYPATPGPQRFGRALPWDVALSRYHLANRFVLNFFGVAVWDIGFSRNKYERLEHVLSLVNVWAFGIGLPILIQLAWCKKLTQQLQKQFRLSKTAKPFEIPFEYLEHHQFRKITAGKNILLKPFGITSANKLNPAFQRAVLKGKIAFLLFDMLALALRGILFYYGRNWLTEKLSGKKGFSGTLEYANDDYRKKVSQNYDDKKKKRLLQTTYISLIGSIILPIAMQATLLSKAKVGQGVLGLFKQVIPKFNYTSAVYMSKWVMLYSMLFHYHLPKLMFSRDKHEFRENLVRSVVYDMFYFIGDDIFSGLASKYFQKVNRKKLGNFKIMKERKFLGFKFPSAVSFFQVFQQVGQNPKNLAFKLARKSYWLGFIGTTACLGVSLPLLNMWYTKKRVMQEQSG